MQKVIRNFDGQGDRETTCFEMPSLSPFDFWVSVTNVPCPFDDCNGTIMWYEAGYAPGYRVCNECKNHFMAEGNTDTPKLVVVPDRYGFI